MEKQTNQPSQVPATKVGGKRIPVQKGHTGVVPTKNGPVPIDKIWTHKNPTTVEQFNNLKIENPTLENPSKAVPSNYYPPQPSATFYEGTQRNKVMNVEKQINQPRRYSQ